MLQASATVGQYKQPVVLAERCVNGFAHTFGRDSGFGELDLIEQQKDIEPCRQLRNPAWPARPEDLPAWASSSWCQAGSTSRGIRPASITSGLQ